MKFLGEKKRERERWKIKRGKTEEKSKRYNIPIIEVLERKIKTEGRKPSIK